MNDTFVTVTGWTGSDVTLSHTSSGQAVATFRIGSTPRRMRNGAWGDDPTLWFTVKCWRQLAEHVAESVRQGEAVVVHGRLVSDTWVKEDGTTSTRQIVVASSVGHDLSRGTSRFTKATREEAVPDEGARRLQEVIHSWDETGPDLDRDGELRPPAVPAA